MYLINSRGKESIAFTNDSLINQIFKPHLQLFLQFVASKNEKNNMTVFFKSSAGLNRAEHLPQNSILEVMD